MAMNVEITEYKTRLLNIECGFVFFRDNCGDDGQEGRVVDGIGETADDRDGAKSEQMKPSALYCNLLGVVILGF